MQSLIENRPIRKSVTDLGVAAYLWLHAHDVVSKVGNVVHFSCNSAEDAQSFDNLVLEYQPPNDFYTFDSCLMYLKKMNDSRPKHPLDDRIHKVVSNLGSAAYLLMQEYKPTRNNFRVIGKDGKNVYFEHPAGKAEDFKSLVANYFKSPFKKYDDNIRALKEFGDYTS